MPLKYLLKAILFLGLSIFINGCIEENPPANNPSIKPSTKPPIKPPTKPTSIKPPRTEPATILSSVDKLWNSIKSKDFSEPDQSTKALAEINTALNVSKEDRESIVKELIKLKEGNTTILHKLLSGPINQVSGKIFNVILGDLPDIPAKKQWLEQVDEGNDALSMLIVRRPGQLGDDPNALRTMINEVANIGPDIKLALEKIWDALRVVDFAQIDEKRAHAIAVLGNIANMTKGDIRIEISRAIVKKSGMEKTDSGLWQSLVQGPIDPVIVKICEVLIDDQADAKAKSDLVKQKIGSLDQAAFYYLTNLNIAKTAASDGPGLRLTTGALAGEAPYLNKLLALFILNGADVKKGVFPQNQTLVQYVKFEAILNRLLANGDNDAFVALFTGIFALDEIVPFVSWAIANNDRGPALKAILGNNKFTNRDKMAFRSQAFQLALDNDLKTVVLNNPPVEVGGLWLFFKSKLYVDKVALINFNRILDHDFGLVPSLAYTDFQFGNFGPLIAMLALNVSISEVTDLDKEKAVIETISTKLKNMQGEKTWKTLVLTPTENPSETAVDILKKELKVSESDAKKLLLI